VTISGDISSKTEELYQVLSVEFNHTRRVLLRYFNILYYCGFVFVFRCGKLQSSNDVSHPFCSWFLQFCAIVTALL